MCVSSTCNFKELRFSSPCCLHFSSYRFFPHRLSLHYRPSRVLLISHSIARYHWFIAYITFPIVYILLCFSLFSILVFLAFFFLLCHSSCTSPPLCLLSYRIFFSSLSSLSSIAIFFLIFIPLCHSSFTLPPSLLSLASFLSCRIFFLSFIRFLFALFSHLFLPFYFLLFILLFHSSLAALHSSSLYSFLWCIVFFLSFVHFSLPSIFFISFSLSYFLLFILISYSSLTLPLSIPSLSLFFLIVHSFFPFSLHLFLPFIFPSLFIFLFPSFFTSLHPSSLHSFFIVHISTYRSFFSSLYSFTSFSLSYILLFILISHSCHYPSLLSLYSFLTCIIFVSFIHFFLSPFFRALLFPSHTLLLSFIPPLPSLHPFSPFLSCKHLFLACVCYPLIVHTFLLSYTAIPIVLMYFFYRVYTIFLSCMPRFSVTGFRSRRVSISLVLSLGFLKTLRNTDIGNYSPFTLT